MTTSMNPKEKLNRFSTFGQILSKESWTTQLLEDFVLDNIKNAGGGQPPRKTKIDELIKWAEYESILKESGKVHAYGPVRGWPPFLETYARQYNEWYQKETGEELGLDPKKHITVVPSLTGGNLLLFQSLCGRDEERGIKYKAVGLVPNYVGAERQFPLGPDETFIAIYQKMKINENDGTFKFETDEETLETIGKALDIPEVKVWYGPRPNNPDGSIIPQETHEKIVKLAEEKGVIFIDDRTYASPWPNYQWDDVECLPIFTNNSIIEHSISKYGGAGDRVGQWICKNDGLMKKLERIVAHSVFHTQQPTQAYMQRLMEKQALFTTIMEANALTEICNTYREFFKRNIQIIIDTFRNECVSFKENKLFICEPQGAFYVFVHGKFPKGKTSLDLYKDLKNKKRTIVLPGEASFFGKPYNPDPAALGYNPLTIGQYTLRLSAVESTPERMKRTILDVCEVFDGYNGIKR